MKIELTCPECQSLIRVEASRSGQQVRCPVCSFISPVPMEGEVVEPAKVGGDPPTPPKPDSYGTFRPRNQPTTLIGVDQRILLSFIWGIGSILSNFVCCGPHRGLCPGGDRTGQRCGFEKSFSTIRDHDQSYWDDHWCRDFACEAFLAFVVRIDREQARHESGDSKHSPCQLGGRNEKT